jgi:dihydroorotate dehydrogenase (fumarate)
VLKLLLAGADVTMMASALLEQGPEYLGVVLDEVEDWLEAHDYRSVEQAKGSMSQRSVPDPAAFARVQYMRALTTYTPSYGSGMAAGPD